MQRASAQRLAFCCAARLIGFSSPLFAGNYVLTVADADPLLRLHRARRGT